MTTCQAIIDTIANALLDAREDDCGCIAAGASQPCPHLYNAASELEATLRGLAPNSAAAK